jgi:hypothetical protein
MEPAQSGPSYSSGIDDLWDTIAALASVKTAAEAGRTGGRRAAGKRRSWTDHAISIVTAASGDLSDNSIILAVRTEWKKHPEWPRLPKTDRAIQMWMAPIRRPGSK